MALRRLVIRGWILLGFVFSTSAYAATLYELVDGSCPAKEKKKSRWVTVGLPWSAGQQVEGRVVPENRSALQFDFEGRTVATPSRCWKKAETKMDTSEVSADAPTERVTREKPKSGARSWLGAGYLTWQETTSLVKNGTGEELPLFASQSGWALFYERELNRNKKVQLHVLLGGFYTASAVAPSSKDQSKFGTLKYQMVDAKTIGGIAVPELLRASSDKGGAFGLGLPLMLRSANWVNAADSSSGTEETYVVQNTSRVLVGAWLVFKLQRPGLAVTGRIGPMASRTNWSWFLGFSREL